MGSENDKKTGLNYFLSAAVVALFGFWGIQTSESNDRIKGLEQTVLKNNDERLKAQMMIVRMQFELSQKINKIDVIEKYLDAMPVPAWLKKKVGDTFEMVMINEAYEREYNVTKEAYAGKTDHDLWDKELADKYFQHDMKVIEKKGTIKTIEIVMKNGKRTEATIYKFYVDLGGDDGVGGLVGC